MWFWAGATRLRWQDENNDDDDDDDDDDDGGDKDDDDDVVLGGHHVAEIAVQCGRKKLRKKAEGDTNTPAH